jgi:hypothetical protein
VSYKKQDLITDITQQKYSGKIAPTPKACEWIKPRSRNFSPKKSQEMVFNKFKSSSNKAPLYSVNASKAIDLSSEKLQRINPDANMITGFSCPENKKMDFSQTAINV